MKNFRLNRKGQFSIIAAMLVAVVLVAAVITTYSSIRYASQSETPQTLSTVDEINLALKRILGFTVGYYGSVLQVTGNTSYAKSLASNYLSSGLDNIADIRPDLSPSFTIVNLDIRTNWYSNISNSIGNFTIRYDLGGLGITGLTYSASSRLDVEVLSTQDVNKALLSVSSDGEPLVNLGQSNFKFYKYVFTNSSWHLTDLVTAPTTYMDGRYMLDLPSGMNSSYVVQVEDTRGLMVVASSFSKMTGTINWNKTEVNQGFDYIDNDISNVDSQSNIGTHSSFVAQQSPPDSVYDVLREDVSGSSSTPYYPLTRTLLGSTTITSGDISRLTSADHSYVTFQSYISSSSTTSKTDASIAYRSSSDGSTVANERTWTGDSASWGSEDSLPSSGSNIRFVRTVYCPVESRSFEKVVVTLSDDGYLDAFIWNGNSWSTTNNIGYVGSTAENYRSFDVAYEKTTGDVLLVYGVYSSNSGRDLAYRTWSPLSDWSSEQYLDDTSQSNDAQYYWIALASNPVAGSNEVTLIGLDGTNSDANGWVWNGNSWGTMRELESSVSTTSRECIAVAYETQSGTAWTAVGSSSSSKSYSIRSQNGGYWSSSKTNPNIYATPYWCTLKADPSSNKMMLVSVDGSSDLNTIYYSGSGSWNVEEHDTSVDSSSQQCADFAWEPTGSKGLLVWGTSKGRIDYKAFTGSSWGSQTFASTSNTNHYWVQLSTNPRSVSGDTKILGAIMDSKSAIVTIKWIGSSFIVLDNSNEVITTSSSSSYECFALAYKNYGQATQCTCQFEFTGNSNLQSWSALTWLMDAHASISGVSVTMQLWNYQTSSYSSSGPGNVSGTVGTSDVTLSQEITNNPTQYRDANGNWKIRVTAVKSASTPFDLSLDLVQYSTAATNYVLSLEEQWVNVASNRQNLCIKTGDLSASESLIVQVWQGGSWHNLLTLVPNCFNNISMTSYISSSTLTIRFVGASESFDAVQDSWNIDSVFLAPQSDIDLIGSLEDSTFTVEFLQNGTIRWLGQNLEITSQTMPIPPIPVKDIHVNETINGVNKEVPFQIEDWSSNYQLPLGLTSNSTVFSNRQMIVFLLTNKVSEFTIWWNGTDEAVQTPLAYTNKYFTGDNPTVTSTRGVLTNGILSLGIEIVHDSIYNSDVFKVTSTAGGSSSTTTFMRINRENSTYGAGQAYVIYHGVVRDVVQQEAEWSGGADNSPDLYASIVLTLPANASYYTYQLRFMFIDSSQQRTLTDMCPLLVSTSLSSVQIQTEDDTSESFPIVQSGSGTFSNDTINGWTAHHWSQCITADGTKGTGIMFTDNANQQLYAFDQMAGTATGALNVNQNAKTIELSPVDLAAVSFRSALDITWSGAVATFDGTTPIYKMDGSTPTGLWILVEHPPVVSVTANN